MFVTEKKTVIASQSRCRHTAAGESSSSSSSISGRELPGTEAVGTEPQPTRMAWAVMDAIMIAVVV